MYIVTTETDIVPTETGTLITFHRYMRDTNVNLRNESKTQHSETKRYQIMHNVLSYRNILKVQ